MIETLIGTALGGFFRLVPEAMKWFERKDERKHELAMFDKQIEADKLKGQLAIQQADAQIGVAEIQAIIEATKAQGQLTGVRWVDAINTLIRPLITIWWCIILYSTALACQYFMLLELGYGGMEALLKLWGPEEKSIVSSLLSFWFLDRTIIKHR
jgi:hypothetical protein